MACLNTWNLKTIFPCLNNSWNNLPYHEYFFPRSTGSSEDFPFMGPLMDDQVPQVIEHCWNLFYDKCLLANKIVP